MRLKLERVSEQDKSNFIIWFNVIMYNKQK